MNNPAEALARLAADLESTRPPTGSPAATFVAGVNRWLADGGTLDGALELGSEGPGRERAITLYRRTVRDRHLKAAHALCAEATPWAQSVALAAEINRFLAVIWPRWANLEAPPAKYTSELRHHLFHAAQAGYIDLSLNRLHDVCTG